MVKQKRPHNLTDRHIKDLIHKEREKVGLNPTSSQDEADCLVVYEYRIGAGKTVISSSADFVAGGHNVNSATVFPREFAIIIVERDFKDNSNNSTGVLWQAELLSHGTSSDISVLADYFIPQMFQRYGKTITNDTFDTPFP